MALFSFRRPKFAVSPRWVSISVAGLLLLAAWSACWFQLRAIDARAKLDAEADAAQIVSSYEEYVVSHLRLIDSALKFVTAYMSENGIDQTAALVRERGIASGILGNISIVGATGIGRAVGDNFEMAVDLHDREHVRAALDQEGDELVVGVPVVARSFGRPAIPFARTARSPGGMVVGAATAAIDAERFGLTFDRAQLGPGGVLTMVGTQDHIIRFRTGPQPLPPGSRLDADYLWRSVAAAPAGVFWRESVVDKAVRVYAYKRVGSFPFVLVAGLAFDDVAGRSAVIERNALATAGGESVIIFVVLVAWLHQLAARRALRRAKDEAEAATRAKNEFLARMSHELRTPMNAIMGFSEIIAGEIMGPVGNRRYVEYAGDVRDSAQHLLHLINDLLDLSRIELGRLQLFEEDLDPTAVVRQVVMALFPQAAKKGFQIAAELPSAALVLRADPRALRQILINLVSNAIKYTPEGGRIGVRITIEPEATLEITVWDTGVGVPVEARSTIFEAFARGDARTARHVEGVGLGLAITRRLVELHGGTIVVGGAVGKGTEMRVRFPAERLRVNQAEGTVSSAA